MTWVKTTTVWRPQQSCPCIHQGSSISSESVNSCVLLGQMDNVPERETGADMTLLETHYVYHELAAKLMLPMSVCVHASVWVCVCVCASMGVCLSMGASVCTYWANQSLHDVDMNLLWTLLQQKPERNLNTNYYLWFCYGLCPYKFFKWFDTWISMPQPMLSMKFSRQLSYLMLITYWIPLCTT